uniref:TFIIS N-terminal domain-containing protein n=1 Tax=Wuchereria bancrofti TaxID=6293 RepID=A0A1I8F0T5_WUCBA
MSRLISRQNIHLEFFVALTAEMNSDEDGEIREKVEQYTRMLSCDNKIGHALRRIFQANINMTLELLSETGVGKAVNQLRSQEQMAKSLKNGKIWSCGLKQRKKRFLSPCSENTLKKKEKENGEKEANDCADEVHCNKTGPSSNGLKNACLGLSFADMLARADIAGPPQENEN